MKLPLLINAKNLKGKRVLLRLDLNVPIKCGSIVDDFRIQKIFPTINFLKKQGAKIIIFSHHSDSSQTLRPVCTYLNNFFPTYFISDIYDDVALAELNKKNTKDLILCENLRFWKGEKENDHLFAKQLAALGDVYVNEAFSNSHNRHASMMLIPKFLPSYAGLLFADELINLSVAFKPPKPFLLILGGGKPAQKFHLVEKYLQSADSIFVAGALAHNFFKASGFEIGLSLYESVDANLDELLRSGKIYLPSDIRVEAGRVPLLKKPSEVTADEKILDVGPQTLSTLRDLINKSAFVLWNGPLGDYLVPGFEVGTQELVKILSASSAQTLAGGGDTVAIISAMKMEEKFDFISTGGGAMLEFLATETLPGIEALKS